MPTQRHSEITPLAGPEHLVDDLDLALAAAPASAVRRGDVPAELLGKASVANLLRLAAEEWAVLAAPWAAMAYGPRWLYPVLALLVAGRLHAFGVILHDAAHMPL